MGFFPQLYHNHWYVLSSRFSLFKIAAASTYSALPEQVIPSNCQASHLSHPITLPYPKGYVIFSPFIRLCKPSYFTGILRMRNQILSGNSIWIIYSTKFQIVSLLLPLPLHTWWEWDTKRDVISSSAAAPASSTSWIKPGHRGSSEWVMG